MPWPTALKLPMQHQPIVSLDLGPVWSVGGGDDTRPEPAGPARRLGPAGGDNERPIGEEGPSTGPTDPIEDAMEEQVANDDGDIDEDMGAVHEE